MQGATYEAEICTILLLLLDLGRGDPRPAPSPSIYETGYVYILRIEACVLEEYFEVTVMILKVVCFPF